MLSGSAEARRNLVLVEGVFDLHQLRAHGVDGVAALGGTGVRPEVEHAVRATRSPPLFVVDPRRLGSAKDPDAYMLTRGIAAWRVLLEERECAIGWRAAEHLSDVSDACPQDARREALSQVGTWLGKLPRRLALEQEDAVRVAADRCGYSIDAVQRSFRARYWPKPTRDPSLGP